MMMMMISLVLLSSFQCFRNGIQSVEILLQLSSVTLICGTRPNPEQLREKRPFEQQLGMS